MGKLFLWSHAGSHGNGETKNDLTPFILFKKIFFIEKIYLFSYKERIFISFMYFVINKIIYDIIILQENNSFFNTINVIFYHISYV